MLLTALAALLMLLTPEASAVGVADNITAAQRTDGSGMVDIHYDLHDGWGAVSVALEVSDDDGATWDITPQAQYLSGNIGPVVNGTGKHIVWDALNDVPNICWPDTRVRILVTDETPEQGEERTIMLPGDVPLVLVWVPAGTFMMGRYPGEQDSEANEDPQHEVTLTQGFYMGKYEVTQQQWLAVMGSWPGTAPNAGVGNNYPAYYVSWNDAQNFVASLNAHITSTGQGTATVRLPSEAEWEYACRAGATTRYYWGDDPSYTQIGSCAWYNGNNSPEGTKPVGGKLPNAFGLYDMSGNVWEWCQDWWGTYPNGPVTDPTGPDSASSRLVRGGSWRSYDSSCRAALRNSDAPDYRDYGLGFRLAASVPEERIISLPGGVPLELVWVPAETFMMGRYSGEQDSFDIEDPQHQVTLSQGFWMGKYEVTQQQWLAVRGSWPETAPDSEFGVGNLHPAYSISWDDAQNFVTSLNAHITNTGQGPATVRLPSEAEWEYACRAGTATRFYWDDDPSYTQIGSYAWYWGNNSPNGTKPVGGKLPNAFGLYDMSGNVYEWCEDDGHSNYTGAPSNGNAWVDSPRGSYRLLRGGSWYNDATYCRAAYRIDVMPVYRRYDLGFRVVRTP